MKQDVFSLILEIEQSANGTTGWSTMINIASANRINEWCEARGANFSTTGHSLGGALAASGSGATGRYACTFNAMGISSNLEKKYGLNIINSKIDAYIIKGEVLNALQPFTANGIQHKLTPKTTDYIGNGSSQNILVMSANNMIYLHSMSRFLEIFRK